MHNEPLILLINGVRCRRYPTCQQKKPAEIFRMPAKCSRKYQNISESEFGTTEFGQQRGLGKEERVGRRQVGGVWGQERESGR